MKYNVTHDIQCIVSPDKNERQHVEPHCHIIKNGVEIAKLNIAPLDVIESKWDDKDKVTVLNYCEEHRSTLVTDYYSCNA